MKSDQPISKEHFIKRFTDLCLRSGLKGFPKDEVDQHILLKSAVLTFGQTGSYTEKEVNERLGVWIMQVGQMKEIDQVTLRRRLVDTGYLTRSKDGSAYQIAQPGPQPGLFEDAINQIDLAEVIQTAREEIARRKREYLEKSQKR
jgi:hypothetical protein